MMKEKTISEIIDSEYKDFSMYVVENRAIASCIDGFKPVQRKVIYATLDKGGKTREIKIADIGGSLSSYNYNHGETSAQGAAVDLAKSWDNNAPVLEGFGNFGSRLVPEAAAPRYIYAKIHKNWDKYFTDIEVAPPSSDIDDPEPEHYIPNIPWILVNGIRGIAIGFATLILPRKIDDLIKACNNILDGKSLNLKTVKPSFPEFKGEIISTNSNGLSWKIIGIIKKENIYSYRITELPPGVSREDYVSILTDLEESGKIRDFEDYCDGKGFNFLVKISKEQDQIISKDSIAFFKLSKSVTENLTTLDENGKLKVFDNVQSLIVYFLNYRIRKSQDKINYDISKLEIKSYFLECKLSFVNKIINKEIDLSIMKKSDIDEYIKKHITEDNDILKKLINTPIYEFNEESSNEIELELTEIYNNIEILSLTNGKERYKDILSKI